MVFSKVYDFKNDLGKFVRSKSIQDGLSGFLKHVGFSFAYLIFSREYSDDLS